MQQPCQIRDYVDPSIERVRKLRARGACGAPNSRHLAAKFCIHCSAPATKEAVFQKVGICIVEKYCESCIELLKQGKIFQVR